MPVGPLPPPPVNDKPGSFTWLEWYRQLRNYVSTSGSVPWYIINFSGSNITDIALRSHQNLQALQGGTTGEMYHLTAAEHASIAGAGVPDGDKGDITVSGGGTVWNIDASTVGITELSATGTPSGSTFLRGDNTWAAASGSVSDGDKGDITVTGSGATWTIDAGTVTLAKMADMATSSLIYRKTAGTGVPEVNTLATLKTDLGLTGTNAGDQTITNTSDATSHTVTLSGSGGSIQLVEGTNITLTTTGTGSAGIVTIAASGGGSGLAQWQVRQMIRR